MQKIYSVDNFSDLANPLSHLPLARGFIESLTALESEPEYVRISGWMLLPDQPMDSVELYVGDTYISTHELRPRRDVQQAFSWMPHGLTAAFSVPVPLDQLSKLDADIDLKSSANNEDIQQQAKESCITKITLVGCQTKGWFAGLPLPGRRQKERIARLSGFVYDEVKRLGLFPLPPEEYRFRVTHNRRVDFFKVGGLQAFGQFMETAAQHTDLHSITRVLDWGCGCGRLTPHFLSLVDGPQEVFGCDIDPDAIAWNNSNIQADVFSVIEPMPPTNYPDSFFDLIVSFSVFTHLSRDVQHAWLSEMQRLLKPGGLFLASVHGEFALEFASPPANPIILNDGFSDDTLDPTLDSIAPQNYYRGTFQTKEYTLREFGKYFQMVDYLERGAMHTQDMVVMRKVA